MAVCGFGKVVVNDTFETEYPFVGDLESRFLYLQDGDKKVLLSAFDFSYRFRRTALLGGVRPSQRRQVFLLPTSGRRTCNCTPRLARWLLMASRVRS